MLFFIQKNNIQLLCNKKGAMCHQYKGPSISKNPENTYLGIYICATPQPSEKAYPELYLQESWILSRVNIRSQHFTCIHFEVHIVFCLSYECAENFFKAFPVSTCLAFEFVFQISLGLNIIYH